MPHLTLIDNTPQPKEEIPFVKARGLSNDFVMIEGDPLKTQQIINIADRKIGIGCDQIIFFRVLNESRVDVKFFNADGSAASACGNGSRALANYLFENALIHSPCRFETPGGEIVVEDAGEGMVCLQFSCPTLFETADLACLEKLSGQQGEYVHVDVGNPHLIAFFDDLSHVDVHAQGPALENSAPFPDRVNVSFAKIISPKEIELVVWERGSGFTGACGTAALAVAAAAIDQRLAHSPVTITQPGGDLEITWHGKTITQTGSAETVFTGVYVN